MRVGVSFPCACILERILCALLRIFYLIHFLHYLEGDVFDDTGISEELLNDDVLNDDDELDEEAYLNPSSTHDEDAILKSPQGSTSSKSPEIPSTDATATAHQKKVVLKRKLVPSLSISEEPLTGITKDVSDPSKVLKLGEESNQDANGSNTSNGSSTGDAHVVKLSQLTMKERLELRAKKFGAAPSTDALKQARAERFGMPPSTTTTSDNSSEITTNPSSLSTSKNVAASVDVLKKRAERFGGSVSNVMVQIENKEKLLKRQERFGSAPSSTTAEATTTATKVSSGAVNDYAEKAKQRLERFKTSA